MKLLQDFFRLRLAAVRVAARRPAALPRDFSVTVPAPLVGAASESSLPVESPRACADRREPASFLRAPRHRRLGRGRR